MQLSRLGVKFWPKSDLNCLLIKFFNLTLSLKCELSRQNWFKGVRFQSPSSQIYQKRSKILAFYANMFANGQKKIFLNLIKFDHFWLNLTIFIILTIFTIFYSTFWLEFTRKWSKSIKSIENGLKLQLMIWFWCRILNRPDFIIQNWMAFNPNHWWFNLGGLIP